MKNEYNSNQLITSSITKNSLISQNNINQKNPLQRQ